MGGPLLCSAREYAPWMLGSCCCRFVVSYPRIVSMLYDSESGRMPLGYRNLSHGRIPGTIDQNRG